MPISDERLLKLVSSQIEGIPKLTQTYQDAFERINWLKLVIHENPEAKLALQTTQRSLEVLIETLNSSVKKKLDQGEFPRD